MNNQEQGTERSALIHRVTRTLALLALYSVLLSFSRYLAYELRFDFMVPKEFQAERLWSVTLSLPIKLGFLLLFRFLYGTNAGRAFVRTVFRPKSPKVVAAEFGRVRDDARAVLPAAAAQLEDERTMVGQLREAAGAAEDGPAE